MRNVMHQSAIVLVRCVPGSRRSAILKIVEEVGDEALGTSPGDEVPHDTHSLLACARMNELKTDS